MSYMDLVVWIKHVFIYKPGVKPQLILTSHHSRVQLQLIACEMLKMADQSHLLLFTNFSSNYCGKQVINIAKT